MNVEPGIVVSVFDQKGGCKYVPAMVERLMKTAKGDSNLKLFQLRVVGGRTLTRWEPSIYQNIDPLQAAILKANGAFE